MGVPALLDRRDVPGSASRSGAAATRVCHTASFLLLFFLCACVTYYDPTTTKHLTDFKVEVLALFDTFGEADVDTAAIGTIRIRLAQAREYERWKGERNQETLRQIEIIQEAFEDAVQNRTAGGRWSSAHLANMKTDMTRLLDSAIETETRKNRRK